MARPAPRPSPPMFHPDIRRAFGWSVPVAVVLLAVGGLIWWQWPNQAPSPQVRAGTILATPGEYTDFIGRISAINGPVLTLPFNIVSPQGQTTVRQYQVTVNAVTEVKTTVGRGEDERLEPGSLETLQPGDVVQVYADSSIAGVTTFVATKIHKLLETSN